MNPYNLSYLDDGLTKDTTYSYYYVIILKNGEEYPDSAIRTITWTKASDISNLRVWQDSENARRIHVEWDDVVEAEYDVDIRINAYGNKSLNWHWSGLPYNTTDMIYRDAIPNTQYIVTVTEPISGKMLSKTINLEKAPRYSRYGARSQGGSITWISHEEEQAVSNVYHAKYSNYDTMSSMAFNAMDETHNLYYRTNWMYSKSSNNHTLDAMIVLRSPTGKVVYDEWFGQEFSAVNGSTTWTWVFPLRYLIQELKEWDTDAYLEPGEYVVEHYLDDTLVNSTSFVID